MFKDFLTSVYLAYRTVIRGHRASTALIVFMMALVFIDLVFISSILRGVLGAIDRQVRVNYVGDVVIEHQEEPVKKDYILRADDLEERLRSMPDVVATSARYKLSGIMSYDVRKDGQATRLPAEVIGIDPNDERGFSDVADSMVAGEYLPDTVGSDDIILGVNLSGGPLAWSTFDTLGDVQVGRKVRVVFSNGVTREFTVRGIFQTKFPFIDQVAFITRQEAESIIGVTGQASQVLVRLDDPAKTPQVQKRIEAMVPNLRVRPWTDYLGVLGEITRTFDIIIGIVSVVGLLVAAVIIFIIVYISVTSRRRQIGILKAIGIPRRVVVWSYVLQAVLYATGGIALGMLIMEAALIPYFAAHPLQVPVGTVGLEIKRLRFMIDAGSLLVMAIGAGLLPSWFAAEENILDAIWGS